MEGESGIESELVVEAEAVLFTERETRRRSLMRPGNCMTAEAMYIPIDDDGMLA